MSPRSQDRAGKVLLVEDDPAIRTIISEVCRRAGYEVVEAATGRSALECVRAREPDVVLLDWVLPDLSGIEVCRELRRRGAICPIIMLTGRTANVDMVVGLEVGADDYITKPFDARVLTARLGAHMRRAEMTTTGVARKRLISVGEVTIDTEGRRARGSDQEVKLSKDELNLPAPPAATPRRVLSRSHHLIHVCV